MPCMMSTAMRPPAGTSNAVFVADQLCRRNYVSVGPAYTRIAVIGMRAAAARAD
jgi:hypothetical protein